MVPEDQSMIVYDQNRSRYVPSPHTVTELLEGAEGAPVLQVLVPEVATASSAFEFEPVTQAYDGDPNTNWTTNGPTTGWLRYKFVRPFKVVSYAIRRRDTIVGRNPSAWTFEGSGDGVSWIILDTQPAVTWPTPGEIKSFEIPNTHEYAYYRINVTANSGASEYLSIAELSMTASVKPTDGGASVLLEVTDDPEAKLTATMTAPNTVVFQKGEGLVGWWDGERVVPF